MNILGVSAGFHDAAVSLIDHHGDILFAGHSERYSGIKNDADIHSALIADALQYSTVDHVAYYERPWKKQLRRLYSGEGVEWNRVTVRQVLQHQLGALANSVTVSGHNHHLSHAAAGFQTSEFDQATVVVIDAIGELDTITIWAAKYDRKGRAQYRQLWCQQYPHSIGLFYSAMTQAVGLKPNEEEYITMGMSAYGKQYYASSLQRILIDSVEQCTFNDNLHVGVDSFRMIQLNDFDMAAAAQVVLERLIDSVMRRAAAFGWSKNLVYMGGVALNCLANRNLGEYFENIWIMPNPGDAGSSLGAAALQYGRRLNWRNAYLGHNIPGSYPVGPLLDHLVVGDIVGVASGRAEFGPRALGNRSLLADPRGPDIKDRVNAIKRRQKFRPFAPVVLEEMADQYFDFSPGWNHSRYMQSVARCRRPDLYPAICHVDGTSRVQTVPKDGSGIRELLEKWYVLTGCPMLLNTSLNIKGEPMVNNRSDADRFQQLYNVSVLS
jgi:carbamoyltransferase